MGRFGLGGCRMDGGWWMVEGVGEIGGELEGKEKHSSLDLISSGSLCKHPVEDGLQEIIIIVMFCQFKYCDHMARTIQISSKHYGQSNI